jgi:hypothetical protein
VFGDRMLGFPEKAFNGECGARECRQSHD